MKRVLLGLALAVAASAESRLVRWSKVALVAATTADAASSYGRIEVNPVLRSANGRFGGRGIALKYGLASAVILVQSARPLRQSPRAVAATNIIASSAFAAVAARNWKIHRK